MWPGITPPAVAFQRPEGTVNPYHYGSSSVQHQLGEKGKTACVVGQDSCLMPCQDRPVVPMQIVKQVDPMLGHPQHVLQQEEQHREDICAEEKSRKQPSGQEQTDFMKQQEILDKKAQELKMKEVDINRQQEELRKKQDDNRRGSEMLEAKTNALISKAKALLQEWAVLKNTREEYRNFEKVQLEQLGREKLEMHKREVLWQQREQEQESQFAKMRTDMRMMDLEIKCRMALVTTREIRVAEQELAMTHLNRSLQAKNPTAVEGKTGNQIQHKDSVSSFHTDSKTRTRVSFSLNTDKCESVLPNLEVKEACSAEHKTGNEIQDKDNVSSFHNDSKTRTRVSFSLNTGKCSAVSSLEAPPLEASPDVSPCDDTLYAPSAEEMDNLRSLMDTMNDDLVHMSKETVTVEMTKAPSMSDDQRKIFMEKFARLEALHATASKIEQRIILENLQL